MRVLDSIRSARASLHQRDAVYVTVWVAVGLATELTARGATSDLQDWLGVAVWAALVAITVLDHIRQPLRLVTAVVIAARRLLRRLPLRPVTAAIDLRGDPAVAQGLPRSTEAALLVSLIGFIGLAMVRKSLPVGLRELLVEISPTLWFAVIGCVWSAAFFCITAMGQGLCMFFVREFSPASRPARQASILLFIGGVVWVSWLVPTWLPLAIAFTCLALVVVLSASRKNAKLTLVFEEVDSSRERCSLDWTQYIAIRGVTTMLASGCLLLLMIGSSPFKRELATSMPLTDGLGRIFAWALCLFSFTLFRQVLVDLVSARRDDPGELGLPRLLVSGVQAAERPQRAELIAAAGFDSLFDESRAACTDVRVAWQGTPLASMTEFVLDESWLKDPSYLRLLARQHQVQCRRALRSGLRLAFEAAAKDRVGSGYWLAPHLWHFEGLKRDSGESETAFTGPRFQEVLPIAARRHLRRILDVLQIDLIFFEDGITFSHFEHVLERLFDQFDKDDVEHRAEEYHFRGVPGALVVLHEHGFGTKLRSGTFPKPDYRFLGRARILHIFREQGGETFQVDVPGLAGGVPDLMPVQFS